MPQRRTPSSKVTATAEKIVDPKRSRAAKKAAITRAKNRQLAAKRALGLHHKFIAGGAVLAVIVFAFLGIRSQLQTFAATSNNGSIVGLAGKCFDNKRAIAAEGNPIQLYSCNGTVAQQWVVTAEGALKANNGSNFCLDVPNNSPSEYVYLRIWTCNGTPAQTFAFTNGALVSTSTGFCATVHYADSSNMTRIWMKKCANPVSSAQKWVYKGAPGAELGTPPTKSITPPPATASTFVLKDAVSKSASGSALALAAGTYTMANFGSDNMGVNASKLTALNGAGRDATVIQMTPNSSSKASAVPGSGGSYNPDAARTNPLYLLKVTGSPTLSNFTLKGTSQGHLYNGLRVHGATNARITNVYVTAIPGNSSVPPGETFGINDYSTRGSVYEGVEVDGSRVGASNFGANNSTNVTINNSNFHDSKNGVGATFWQTNGVTVNGGQSVNNSNVGYNFERVTGTIRITGAKTSGNPWCDYRMASDKSSANYTITDPQYTGSKLRICYKSTYNGHRNTQSKAAIKVIIGGVDKTSSVVQWVN